MVSLQPRHALRESKHTAPATSASSKACAFAVCGGVPSLAMADSHDMLDPSPPARAPHHPTTDKPRARLSAIATGAEGRKQQRAETAGPWGVWLEEKYAETQGSVGAKALPIECTYACATHHLYARHVRMRRRALNHAAIAVANATLCAMVWCMRGRQGRSLAWRAWIYPCHKPKRIESTGGKQALARHLRWLPTNRGQLAIRGLHAGRFTGR